MTRRNKILVSAIGIMGIAGASVMMAPATFAALNPSDLAAAIATKFNLNETEVSQVIQTFHNSMRDEKIAQLVTEGKITEAQKTKYIELLNTLDAKRQSLESQNLTREQMDTQTKTEKDALDAWIKDQGLENVLRDGRGGGGPGNMEDHLAQLLTDVKITEAQKTKFQELQNALHTKMDSLKDQNLTRDEIETQTKTEKDAIDTWLKEQGLTEILKPAEGPGGFKGGRGMREMMF